MTEITFWELKGKSQTYELRKSAQTKEENKKENSISLKALESNTDS